MSLPLTPITLLLAVLVLTTVLVASVTRQQTQLFVPLLTATPLVGFGSGWVAAKFDSKATEQSQVVEVSASKAEPIKLQLRWRSDTPLGPEEEEDMAPKLSDMPPPPLPSPSARNNMPAHVQANVRSMKRFSLQLPPLPGTSNSSDDVKDILTGSAVTSPESEFPLSTRASSKPPTPDANDFLTALAAQERRVLELKEELGKAEADLTNLKKQWALHEALKKRNEIRHVEPLRPMKSPNKESFSSTPTTSRSMENDNRRRAVSIRTKPSRTIFEGGRHTRTLSLLSPTSLENRNNVVETLDGKIENKARNGSRAALLRVSTAPIGHSAQQSGGTRDDLVYTGKQFVGDLKDGLFNFIEDLRAATVGDEALSPARSKQIESSLGTSLAKSSNKSKDQRIPNQVSLQSSRVSPTRELAPSVKAVSSQTVAPESESALQQPIEDATSGGAEQREVGIGSNTTDSVKPSVADEDDEGWSNWDSPPPKDTASGFSNTARSTPRSSLR